MLDLCFQHQVAALTQFFSRQFCGNGIGEIHDFGLVICVLINNFPPEIHAAVSQTDGSFVLGWGHVSRSDRLLLVDYVVFHDVVSFYDGMFRPVTVNELFTVMAPAPKQCG